MAPTTKPAVAKRPPKALPPLEKPVLKKKMKNKTFTSFSIYLYKLLKTVSQDSQEPMGISRKAMAIMNNFVMDMLEKMANESGKLVAHSKTNTLRSREVQTAVKLLIPGELSKHANNECLKAITMYHNSRERDVAKN